MITNDKILELVRSHFQEGGMRDDGSCSEYYGTTEDFIDFALKIHEMGYNKGYDEGWESRAESEYTMSGLYGEPQ
jgi:hypothetical protein